MERRWLSRRVQRARRISNMWTAGNAEVVIVSVETFFAASSKLRSHFPSLVVSSSESPSRKRIKLPGSPDDDDDGATPLSFKGLKKGQIRKIQKEQAKLEAKMERKLAKEREKVAIAERKKMRGELYESFSHGAMTLTWLSWRTNRSGQTMRCDQRQEPPLSPIPHLQDPYGGR